VDSLNQYTARAISNILSLPFIAAAAVVVFSFFSPEALGPVLTPVEISLLGITLIAVAPIALVLYLLAKGRIDIHTSEGERPPAFFLPPVAAYSVAAIVFGMLKCTTLYRLSTAYLATAFVVLVVTLFWRVSIHMAGLTGPITALILVFGIQYSLLFLLAVPLGWARTELKAHTLPQVVFGAVVGVVTTSIVYAKLI
jgi:hypothetical protein